MFRNIDHARDTSIQPKFTYSRDWNTDLARDMYPTQKFSFLRDCSSMVFLWTHSNNCFRMQKFFFPWSARHWNIVRDKIRNVKAAIYNFSHRKKTRMIFNLFFKMLFNAHLVLIDLLRDIYEHSFCLFFVWSAIRCAASCVKGCAIGCAVRCTIRCVLRCAEKCAVDASLGNDISLIQ